MAVALGLACTGEPGPKTPDTSQKRDTEVKHESCDAASSGASKVDVNGDGKPDIVHVMSGGKEACRVVDLNLDGTVDAYIYYDDGGRERRRESDFDRDGRADEIAVYKDGRLVMKMRETNFDNKLDTWDHYDGDRLVRRERDSDGDAIIDQWWTFNNPTNAKCALVATDRNADGKPDPDTVVDLCGEGYTGPKAAGATPAGAASASPAPPPPATAAPTPPAAPPAAASVTASVSATGAVSAKVATPPVPSPPKK